ncbi:unnamed protein product [Pleuronectes platessa]|uniref:Uncharacterized protein n=1 Tax=Pleuronectes platessa TaxID=8262 RepID=A0A9N7UK97_PLEPL|nr:unnamed protein product [Pleuronectes platessa]
MQTKKWTWTEVDFESFWPEGPLVLSGAEHNELQIDEGKRLRRTRSTSRRHVSSVEPPAPASISRTSLRLRKDQLLSGLHRSETRSKWNHFHEEISLFTDVLQVPSQIIFAHWLSSSAGTHIALPSCSSSLLLFSLLLFIPPALHPSLIAPHNNSIKTQIQGSRRGIIPHFKNKRFPSWQRWISTSALFQKIETGTIQVEFVISSSPVDKTAQRKLHPARANISHPSLMEPRSIHFEA